MPSGRIFVGNLPMDIREKDLNDFFYKYGKITRIEIKNHQNPPAFAFISFDDDRDANDAVRGRNRYMYDGQPLRVEFAKSDRRDRSRSRSRGRSRDRGGRSRDRKRSRSPTRRYVPSKAAEKMLDFGVILSGLPKGFSWQSLKDHGRNVGHVEFSEIIGGGEGLLNFSNNAALETALESSKLKNLDYRGESFTITVRRALDDKRFKGGSGKKDDDDDDHHRRRHRSSESRSVSRGRKGNNDNDNNNHNNDDNDNNNRRDNDSNDDHKDRDRSHSRSSRRSSRERSTSSNRN